MPSGRIQRLTTYHAVYRLAARPYALSAVAAGAGRIQLATLHHLASSLSKVELRNVWVALESASAAAIVDVDLVRISTAPATGNPVITPAQPDLREVADSETIALALPTTPGTEGAVLSSVEWNLGITGAASTANPPPQLNYVDLLSPAQAGYNADELSQMVVMRPGVLEGYAVTADISAAATVKGFVIIRYTKATYIGNQG